jgi:hypothetical protein
MQIPRPRTVTTKVKHFIRRWLRLFPPDLRAVTTFSNIPQSTAFILLHVSNRLLRMPTFHPGGNQEFVIRPQWRLLLHYSAADQVPHCPLLRERLAKQPLSFSLALLGKVAEKVPTCGEIMNLLGNTIFISGGGSGIGRALAEGLHQRGSKVIVWERRTGHLEVAILIGDESQLLVPVRRRRWNCQAALLRLLNNIGREVPIGRPKRSCHPRGF